jgi:probable phosphomutase (TIGR03848 family)
MPTYLLIRHAAHDLLGKAIAGRMPGVHLNREGQIQAEQLVERLAHLPIEAVYSSPLERAQETARPLAGRLDLPLLIAEEMNEIDFGEWTGKSLQVLKPAPRWGWFNSFRSGTRIPSGEMMLEAQTRAVTFMDRLREEHRDGCIALVGHGDVIKAAVAYYLGVPLDLFGRIEIHPASVSVIRINDYGPQVLKVNDTGDIVLG